MHFRAQENASAVILSEAKNPSRFDQTRRGILREKSALRMTAMRYFPQIIQP
jgi:hypothetical protein